jgi:NAD(P)H-dependent flavin oxidoreductase YrpB (nitropropane dioxygenase family)
MLPEADKFDGMGWVAWKTKISAHIKARGLGGYIDGTIPTPRPAPVDDAENLAANVADLIALPPEPTVVYLRTPLSDKWDYCNGITTSILVLNVKDPVGISLKTDGSACNAWKSLVDIYAHQTDMAISCVLRDLNTTYYAPGMSVVDHTAVMCKLQRTANNFGTNITDGVFRMTFIASLGEPWRHVTPVLRTYNTSAKVINFLIEEEQAHNGNNVPVPTTALAVNTLQSPSRDACKAAL